MAKAGIEHVVSAVPIAQTTFVSEEFHVLTHGNSFPASPVEKQLFYRDDLHIWYIYNGTAWTDLTAAAIDELNDIGDVYVPTPTDEFFLYWDDPNSRWACRALVAGDIPDLSASKITSDTLAIARLPTGVKTATITFIIDGGGSAITTGQKGHLEIPFACTINRVTMLADVSGSIVVDIWKDTYANFPPLVGDSITAADKPTITTAQMSQNSTLTGWTTAIAAGDILAFNVDSCTTIERVTISLKVTKT